MLTCSIFVDSSYRTPNNPGACAINDGGATKFHERCSSCSNDDCKAQCTSDSNCKGYVAASDYGCQWATTSDCPAGCTKYDQGKVGDLLVDKDWYSSNYEGCFIKQVGKMVHFIHHDLCK